MIEVSDDILIEAPVNEVYEYMDDPHSHAEVTPSITDVRNVKTLENGGKRLEYTYTMGGVGLDGELEEVEHVENSRMTFEMKGELEGKIDLTYEGENGRTRMTYSAEYDVPTKVLEKLVEPFVRKYNGRELRTTLENVKTRMEAES
jgi:carbon monoxide dehydrogenase subunit G